VKFPECSTTAEKVLFSAILGLKLAAEREFPVDDFLKFRLPYPEVRRTVAGVLFTFFRRKRVVDSAIRYHSERPVRGWLMYILEVAVTQLLFQDAIPPQVAVAVAVEFAGHTESGEAGGNFANWLLRRVAAAPPAIPTTAEKVFPPELYRHWKSFMPKMVKNLAAPFLERPDLTFRSDLAQPLPGALPCNLDFTGKFRFFRLPDGGVAVNSAELADGKIYIQDPATALAVDFCALTGSERVCDLCAAPGGKSLMLAELLNKNGELVMYDRSEVRQKLTRENFSRRRFEAPYRIEVRDALSVAGEGDFDVVLCDVPCSNTGVFRRRPDALWRFSLSKLANLAALQYSILGSAAKMVKSGGRLIYSTCSIEPAENGENVAKFVAADPDFEIVGQRQLYPCREHDGGYAAVLRKIS